MKLVIEVRKLEDVNVYEAVLVRGEPELGVGGSFNISCKDNSVNEASMKLRLLLDALGWKGDYEVRYVEVITYNSDERFKEKTVKISSRSRYWIDHTVSFKEDRDPQYICSCEDFTFRRKHLGEWCDHIFTAIRCNYL